MLMKPVARGLVALVLASAPFGAAWPICAEGSASGLGYEPYSPCPAGMILVEVKGGDSAGFVASANGGLCLDASAQRDCPGSGLSASCSAGASTIPRPLRSEPNYVDLSTANGAQRFYFSLRGY